MSYIMADVEELYETGIDTGMKPTLPRGQKLLPVRSDTWPVSFIPSTSGCDQHIPIIACAYEPWNRFSK
jgi:hypothetical protein